MEDHDCVVYSNTAEIFFTQRDQLHTVKSFNIMTTLLLYATIVDVWNNAQVPTLHNKTGSWELL